MHTIHVIQNLLFQRLGYGEGYECHPPVLVGAWAFCCRERTSRSIGKLRASASVKAFIFYHILTPAWLRHSSYPVLNGDTNLMVVTAWVQLNGPEGDSPLFSVAKRKRTSHVVVDFVMTFFHATKGSR